MQSKATSVKDYLASLPDDRRKEIEAVRKVVRDNLDPLIEEGMQYGMIGYYVPHSVFPAGYHCDPKQPLPFAGLASQKNHLSLYLMCVYGGPLGDEFREAWEETGKKLDMGKACVRFKKAEDLALDVIGKTIKRVTAKKYVDFYEDAMAKMGKGTGGKAPGRGAKAPGAAVKKKAAKKKVSKKKK
ncbi:MAG TPA: DUF1801 domain-containing protein [Phycisphaerales bacterium]|nr:DUF1801 domain-containing protein [Phycisphaerales bacterium]